MANERIPFALWISAAVVAHLSWSAGADTLAKVMSDISDVRYFAQSVKGEFTRPVPMQIEIEAPELEQQPEVAEPPQEAKTEPEKPKEPEPPKVPPPAPPMPEQPKVEEPKVVQVLPEPAKPTPPPPQLQKDSRIAVKQHVKDKDQDNPNAAFVGDEANVVEEESVARITSNDQDDPNPTPGGQKSGPTQEPGNAEQTRIGQSDDAPGDPDKAPGENADEHFVERKERAAAQVPRPPAATANAQPPRGDGRPRGAPPVPEQTAQPQPLQPPDSPETVASEQGGYSLDPRRKSRPSTSAAPLPTQRAPQPSRIGLGAGPNDRGVRTSLAVDDVVAAVGADELTRQRAADGERRRSQHRGSWQTSTFERWRASIENYVSSVRPGNQTALNTARVPFASYLVMIHNRIHPVFADRFLDSLDALPITHALNDYKLQTHLEIVVDREQGRVKKLGVVKTSGMTAFDVGALDAVWRSQPFGKAPDDIVSADGNVYLHWEFHRNPIFACSTMNARPFILNSPPAIEPQQPPSRPPRQPSDPRERGVPPVGEGPSRFGRAVRPPKDGSSG